MARRVIALILLCLIVVTGGCDCVQSDQEPVTGNWSEYVDDWLVEYGFIPLTPDLREGGEELTVALPLVAIIIDDMGLWTEGARVLTQLDYPLTFAFLPDAPHVEEQVEMVLAHGNEVMLHVPMEALPRVNDYGHVWTPYPGSGAVTTGMGRGEIEELLVRHLSMVSAAVGVNNHMGSAATGDYDVMVSVLSVLGERGLFFVDSMTTPHSTGRTAAIETGVLFAANDLFLDHVIDEQVICERIYQLAELARENGFAVGIGHPHLETANALARMLPIIVDEGVVLVLVSSLVGVIDRGEGDDGQFSDGD